MGLHLAFGKAFFCQTLLNYLDRLQLTLQECALHLHSQWQEFLFHFCKMRLNVFGQIITAFGGIIARGTLKNGTFGCETTLETTMTT